MRLTWANFVFILNMVEMRRVLYFLLLSILVCACSSTNIFDEQAGSLRLAIDNTGRITALENIPGKTDYIATQDNSYLIECRRYDRDTSMVKPISARNLGEDKIELAYPSGVKICVEIVPMSDYFKMKVIDVTPLSEVSHITWGPYYTNMQGYIGEWLGLVRSDDFTIGIMSLEPNTDGPVHMSSIASYTKEGASLTLTSFDHTRGVYRDLDFRKEKETLLESRPIPVTVLGSCIALYSSVAGKENELDAIERIELNEDLPHPMFDGKWNKRSTEGQKFCIWTYYDTNSFDECLAMSKEMGARIICKSGGIFDNWGHFDPEKKIYPEGIKTMREQSVKANEVGIGTTLYTLTTFLKPINTPEPYISPVPDDRLQTWKYDAELAEGISAKDTIIYLKNDKNVLAVLNAAGNKVIRLGNEMIEFKKFEVSGDRIIAKECERGVFFTTPDSHGEKTKAKMMFVEGYRNFYPGTIEMSNEMSDRLFEVHKESLQSNFVVDGFESCLAAGYGPYTGNLFMRNFYDKCVANNFQTLVTGSNFTQYTWHINSHESWGEGDTDKGIRGTMLDYRIGRQVLLNNSLMPKKLGQYYPTNATVEDVEWLMGFATGWDSGVDFVLKAEAFRKNPQFKEVVAKLRLWAQAREENAFTEEQKMNLRQSDRQYTLTRKDDGSWDLRLNEYWRFPKAKTLPSSVMAAKVVSGGSIRPCSIDWLWTHNPAPYYEIFLSDDMVHGTGSTTSYWNVYYPSYTDSEEAWFPEQENHFQFLVRLPKDSPCAVKNIKVGINGNEMIIPIILNPGEYISMPHLVPLFCIYNEKHEILYEKHIRGNIISVKKGSEAQITISCEPLDASATPDLIVNVRGQNGHSKIKW